ncbi:unnamed protein product [Orchesella dallaii]|uniref:Carboxylesterase type B domain-containing protein n=1 Tax=Orchesella dallaii TaxID=48710 RepID=A0ABP1QHD9_9HEXA
MNWVGVAHKDDLIYLLNSTDYYSTIDTRDENEVNMSNIMTGIWSNFAQYGKPYISDGERLIDVWQPIARSTNPSSPLNFLDLNLRPRMAQRPSGRWSNPRRMHNFLQNPFGSPVLDDKTNANISSPIVVLKDGILKGFVMETISGRPISAFQSIPFAQALRFEVDN